MPTIDTSMSGNPGSPQTTSLKVTVYHNDEARFMPYQDGHALTAVTSHWLDADAATDPPTIGDWLFHAFNADLDLLETQRHRPGGEILFLAACIYRMRGYRSLSVGDVIAIDTEAQTHWLACDPYAWRPISEPASRSGEPLSAAVIYEHITSQRPRP